MKVIQSIKLMPALVLLACSPKVDSGGYMKEGDLASQIVPGQTTKDEVLARLGSPSSQSTFGDEAWYYITERKETTAFFKPEIAQEDVLRIQFDKAGMVSKVENFNHDSGKEFDVVSRTTPTEGHTLGFFEQVLGNLGRFNKPGGAGDTAAPGRRPGGGKAY